MSKKRRKGSSGGGFVQVFNYIMESAAWKDLSVGARATYVELKKLYNGSNNGRLGFGSRGAANVLGKSKSMANRYLKELEDHGFIVRQRESSYYQTRMTVEWCLTEARNDVTGEAPTRLFRNWPNIENQTPVPPVARPVPPVGQKKEIPASSASHSPTSGTKTANDDREQSHLWDTSTSKPEGGAVLGWSVPALTRQVRRICETAAIAPDDSRSASAKAVAVAQSIYHDLTEDPLLQCVGRVFPGSRFVLTKAEIEDRLSKLQAA
ncbi:hypothetical protein [Devosia elaeis]|nr:hypothetical protein [Devosia elaeis]